MHLNLHFSAVQVIWTLTFASLLVLLVVLMGRDRTKLYPFFTLSILLTALRLLASRLLYGRMAPVMLSEIFIILADVSAVVGILVVIEMARRAFRGVSRRAWLIASLLVLAVAGGVLAAWGPWPSWKTITADSSLAVMRLMQLCATKADMLIDVLTIEVGLLIFSFGRHFSGGWRTHTQRIVIGLWTASVGQLLVQGIWQIITKTATPRTQAEYDHVIGLREKLFNANGALYVLVLIWWIVCLWMDGASSSAAQRKLNTEATALEDNSIAG